MAKTINIKLVKSLNGRLENGRASCRERVLVTA